MPKLAEGRTFYSSNQFAIRHYKEERDQQHVPAALSLFTNFTGGWVNPGSVRTAREISTTPVFNPRTVQPAASRYTDYAIPFALTMNNYHI
jgi:hypothetical protein